MNEAKNESTNGWVKLYHPRGPLVTLPVDGQLRDYRQLLEQVSSALDAGWLAVAPGLESGEQVADVSGVIRRTKENGDGTDTPVVDLYLADTSMVFAILSVYLNTDDQVADFEAASGLKLDQIPPYVGSNKVELGKSKQTDMLLRRSQKPFRAVWKDNPKHDPKEPDAKKMKPKRIFVRWDGVLPSKLAEPELTENNKMWLSWIARKPELTVINRALPDIKQAPTEAEQMFAWQHVRDYAHAAGFVFDTVAKQFRPVGNANGQASGKTPDKAVK